MIGNSNTTDPSGVVCDCRLTEIRTPRPLFGPLGKPLIIVRDPQNIVSSLNVADVLREGAHLLRAFVPIGGVVQMGALFIAAFYRGLAYPAATLPNSRVSGRGVYGGSAGVAKHPSPQPCYHHQDNESNRRDSEVVVCAVLPLQLCFQVHSSPRPGGQFGLANRQSNATPELEFHYRPKGKPRRIT